LLGWQHNNRVCIYVGDTHPKEFLPGVAQQIETRLVGVDEVLFCIKRIISIIWGVLIRPCFFLPRITRIPL